MAKLPGDVIPPPPPQPPTDDDDYLRGGGGKDVINGLGGNDVIDGGANKDRLHGEAGDDVLNGGGSDDVLRGGEGDDYLFGGGQDDRMIGGDGADHLVGGNDDDVMYLGLGNGSSKDGYADIVYFDEDDGNDKVFGFETGLDLVVLDGGVSYDLHVAGSNSFLTFGTTTVVFYNAILADSDIVFGSSPEFNDFVFEFFS